MEDNGCDESGISAHRDRDISISEFPDSCSGPLGIDIRHQSQSHCGSLDEHVVDTDLGTAEVDDPLAELHDLIHADVLDQVEVGNGGLGFE